MKPKTYKVSKIKQRPIRFRKPYSSTKDYSLPSRREGKRAARFAVNEEFMKFSLLIMAKKMRNFLGSSF